MKDALKALTSWRRPLWSWRSNLGRRGEVHDHEGGPGGGLHGHEPAKDACYRGVRSQPNEAMN